MAAPASGAWKGGGLPAPTVHPFASYLLVSNSINFYAFIVFN